MVRVRNEPLLQGVAARLSVPFGDSFQSLVWLSSIAGTGHDFYLVDRSIFFS